MDGPPTHIGRYRLGALLGEGGGGRVYASELEGPGGRTRPVALKILHDGDDSLRREARIGGLLRHRNLVDVYEIGEDGGVWYCVMERCDGSVSEHVPLPPRAVVEVGLQVCGALAYAHEELGLVHADLKPPNLLLREGVVKVADLGIAHAEGVGERPRLSGTPGYMPPEQLAGVVEARSDLYALGVTLVELAMGRRPTTIQPTISLDDLDDGVAVPSEVPPWLAPAVARCLAYRPEDRWPDIEALAEALGRLDVSGPGLREVLGLSDEEEEAGRAEDAAQDQLVGREPELAAVLEALAGSPLVTVRGPPGIGKSRVAREAALRRGGQVAVCSVAEARSVEGLCFEVARALGVPLGGDDPVTRLGHALSSRAGLLLVLDDSDRVQELPQVLQRWLAAAPHLSVLVTRRQAVGIDAERLVAIGPLDEPAACALIVARARQRGTDPSGDPALPELARRLDGLPLALELAAGRLGVLTVGDVLERLDLSLLRRGTDDRHGTLRAALDWSWSQLTDTEQALLAQLSVFSGGFTEEAVQAVVEVDGPPLDRLASLVSHSWVVDEGQRLRLLETVHRYASEHGSDPALEHRHGAHYAALIPGDFLTRSTRRGLALARAMGAELDNLIMACRRGAARGDGEVTIRTLGAVIRVLLYRGPYRTGLELVAGARSLSGLTRQQTCCLDMYEGLLLRAVGDTQGAAVVLERAAVSWTGSERGQVGVYLADTLRALGRFDEARGHLERALELATSQGNLALEARARCSLGLLDWALGRYAEAAEKVAASCRLTEQFTSGPVPAHQCNLGFLYRRLGRWDDAERELKAARRGAAALDDPRLEARVLGNLGTLYAAAGRLDEARTAMEDALKRLAAMGSLASASVVTTNLAEVLHHLGESTVAVATMERALTLSPAAGPRRRARDLGRHAVYLRAVGRHDDAWQCLHEALGLARSCGDDPNVGLLLGRLAVLTEDEDAADALLEEGVTRAGANETPDFYGEFLVSRAEVLARRGRRDEALAELVLAEALPGADHVFRLTIAAVRERIRPAGARGAAPARTEPDER